MGKTTTKAGLGALAILAVAAGIAWAAVTQPDFKMNRARFDSNADGTFVDIDETNAAAADRLPQSAPGNNTFPVGDGTNWVTESASDARTSLGLGTMATQNASAVAITGGTITGTTFNNGAIGGSTPSTGAFTDVMATGTADFDGDVNMGDSAGDNVLVAGSMQVVEPSTFDAEIELNGDPAVLKMANTSSGQEGFLRAGLDEWTFQLGLEGWTVAIDDHGLTRVPDVSVERYIFAEGPIVLDGEHTVIIDANSDDIDPDEDPLVQLDPDANRTLTSTPTVINGTYVGELLTLYNKDAAFSVTLQDNSDLAGSDLYLVGGGPCTIGPHEVLNLIYNETLAGWVEHSRGTAQQNATTLNGGTISDTAYGGGWNGDTANAPSKNAVYDKIESVVATIPTPYGSDWYRHYSTNGNSGTSETEVLRIAFDNEIASDGERATAVLFGALDNTVGTSTKRIRIYVDSSAGAGANTLIFDTGALSLSASGAWSVSELSLVHDADAHLRCSVPLTLSGASVGSYAQYTDISDSNFDPTDADLVVTLTSAGVGAASDQLSLTGGYGSFW